MSARSWGVSLALHGLVAGTAWAFLSDAAVPPAQSPWRVSLVSPPPPAATVPPPAVPSPSSRAPRQPREPLPARPPARVAITPQPAPAAQVRQAEVIEAASALPAAGLTSPVAMQDAAPPQAEAALPPATVPQAVTPVQAAARMSPARQSAPMPPPGSTGEPETGWQDFLAARMARLQRYPLFARRHGEEGVVVLEARIRSAAEARVSIKQSSGHNSLDRAALKLFEEAMPALEGMTLPSGESVLVIPVAYRLEN